MMVRDVFSCGCCDFVKPDDSSGVSAEPGSPVPPLCVAPKANFPIEQPQRSAHVVQQNKLQMTTA